MINEICNSLGVSPDDIWYRRITYKALLDYLENKNGSIRNTCREHLGISHKTVAKYLRPFIPVGIRNPYSYLLENINYKKCTSCNSLKILEDFNSRKDKKRINTQSVCIPCQRNTYSIHAKENKEYMAFKSSKRRAAKLQRTPTWSDLEKIKEIYNNCPEGHHVDHIIPLQGEKVSGLHIPENLQYLTVEENLKKGNKFDV